MTARGQNDTPASNAQAGAGKARQDCVLLHASGGATVPTDLLASLAKRIPHITTHSDSYRAFAEVCALAKGRGGELVSTVVLVLVDPVAIGDAEELVDELRMHAPTVAVWWYAQKDGRSLRKLGPGERAPWTAQRPADNPLAPPVIAERRATPGISGITGRMPVPQVPFRASSKPVARANEPPRVVVRPNGPSRGLRLVGKEQVEREGASAHLSPERMRVGVACEPVAGAPGSEEADQRRVPLLTEEELRMLLSDDVIPPAPATPILPASGGDRSRS